MYNAVQVSTVLPRTARELLMRAANTEPQYATGDSRQREIEVARAIDIVRRHYPEFFQPQKDT